MTLVDSSAWIEFLRKNGNPATSARVDALLESDTAAICGMVELEVLQGLRQHEARRLHTLLQALHFLETTRADYVNAGHRLRRLRQKGVTIPASDSLIASVAARHGHPVLTTDRHFRHFTGLKLV